MLRKPEDQKEWQKEESLPKDAIIGMKAPEGIPSDDTLEVPEEVIPTVEPVEAPKPKRKPSAKKKTTK